MPIDAGELVLRPLRADDAGALVRYRSDPEVSRYQNWSPQGLSDVLEFIEAQSRIERFAPGIWTQFAIAPRATDEPIGDCGVCIARDDPDQAQLGITLHPERQGAGHATAVVRALLRELFCVRSLHRVSCSADPSNVRSVALLERTGFRREGLFLESLRFKGRWADDTLYAMLRREWLASG